MRDITKADLSAYEAHWWAWFEAKYQREPADATVNNMQVAIIQFFRYLEMEELIDRNPARLIKPVRRTQRANDWLRPDEDRAMMAGPKNLRERFTCTCCATPGCASARPPAWSIRTWTFGSGR